MTFEELKKKANKKDILLQDLEIEEILKFNEEGFLNPSLTKNFDLTLNQVKNIRRKKGLIDSEYEDLIRNIIVIYDILNEEFPYMVPFFINQGILAIATGFGSVRKKEAYYLDKIKRIDWINMNPKDEIKKKKIDVEYRKERYKELFNKHLEIMLKIDIDDYKKYTKENCNNSLIIIDKVRKPKNNYKKGANVAKNVTIKQIPRDSKVAENALKYAGYKCEWNNEHPTFLRRKNNMPYMEAHHLIPLEYQELFEYSLDIEPNIISLCSNCHKEIHYGKNYKELVEKFYYERKEELTECWIEIELEELFKLYEKDSLIIN